MRGKGLQVGDTKIAVYRDKVTVLLFVIVMSKFLSIEMTKVHVNLTIIKMYRNSRDLSSPTCCETCFLYRL